MLASLSRPCCEACGVDGKNVATRLKEEVRNILAELRGRNAEIRVKNEETADLRAEK